MKYLFVIFVGMLISFRALALQFEVIGKSGERLAYVEQKMSLVQNLGQISVDIFKQQAIAYQGDESGISRIFDLGADLEVISDQEMKAYGWCFSVNNEIPETMPDLTFLTSQTDAVRWFYAYAHYKNGEWVSMCERP